MGANQWKFNEALSNVGNFWANQILRQNERDRMEAEKQKQLAMQKQRNEYAQRVINKGTFQETTEPTPIDVPDNLGIYTPKQEQTDFMPLAPNKTVQPQTPNVPFKQAQTYQTYNKFLPDDERTTNAYAMQLAGQEGGAETLGAYDKIQKLLNPQGKYSNFQKDNPNIAFDTVSNKWKDIRTGQEVDPTQFVKPDYVYGKENKYVQIKDPINGQLKTALDEKGQPIKNNQWDAPEELISKTTKNGKVFEQWGKPTWENDTANPTAYKKVGDMNYRLGRTHSYNATAVNAKGDGTVRMTKDISPLFNKQYKDVLKAKGMWLTDRQNNATDATEKAKNLANRRQDYVNTVKSTLPIKLKEWYDKVWNAYDKKDPTSNEFWGEFMDAYKNGAFKKKVTIKKKNGEVNQVNDPGGAEFDFARELFRALYLRYPDTQDVQIDDNNEAEYIEE